MGKRQEKIMEKQAGIMVESFGQARQEATEVELASVTQELRKNPAAMYTMSSLLKNDNLVALLDGRLQGCPKTTPTKVTNLRVAYTKFKHVTKTTGLIEKVLDCINPEASSHDVMRHWSNMPEKLGVMCMALHVSGKSTRPNQYYADLSSQDAFLSACSQRYERLGGIMAGRKLADMTKGWFDVENENTVPCFLGKEEPKATQAFGENASNRILQPFEMTTAIEVTQYGRQYLCTDLKSGFEEAAVRFPDTEEKWRLRDAKRKRSRTPRQSRRKHQLIAFVAPTDAGASSSTAPRPITSGLSVVLAKRLQTQACAGAK